MLFEKLQYLYQIHFRVFNLNSLSRSHFHIITQTRVFNLLEKSIRIIFFFHSILFCFLIYQIIKGDFLFFKFTCPIYWPKFSNIWPILTDFLFFCNFLIDGRFQAQKNFLGLAKYQGFYGKFQEGYAIFCNSILQESHQSVDFNVLFSLQFECQKD